jgi:hypothetical protein
LAENFWTSLVGAGDHVLGLGRLRFLSRSIKGIGELTWASPTALVHEAYHEVELEEIAEKDMFRLDQPYARMVYGGAGEDISRSRYGEMRGRR